MFRRRLLFAGLATLHFLLLLQTCRCSNFSPCDPSSCGSIRNITYPFRLETDPSHCGDERYTLLCENNATAVLYLYSGKYYVRDINYDNFTIRLADAGLNSDDCSSIPRFPLVRRNFSADDPYVWYKHKWGVAEFEPSLSQTLTFLSCANTVNSSLYVDTASCSSMKQHSYVCSGRLEVGDLMNMCSIEMMVMLPAEKDYRRMSFPEIHRELANGFELSWHNIYCNNCRSCYFDEADNIRCLRGKCCFCL